MSNRDIRKLLTQLKDEVNNAELDPETRALISELDSDIHGLLSAEQASVESASVLRRAQELEARFETKHPTTVRIVSEVIEALSRMGI